MGRLGEGSGENEFFWHPGHRGGADSRGKLVAEDRSRVRAGALLRPGGSPHRRPQEERSSPALRAGQAQGQSSKASDRNLGLAESSSIKGMTLRTRAPALLVTLRTLSGGGYKRSLSRALSLRGACSCLRGPWRNSRLPLLPP